MEPRILYFLKIETKSQTKPRKGKRLLLNECLTLQVFKVKIIEQSEIGLICYLVLFHAIQI